jgi:hypothetical protein
MRSQELAHTLEHSAFERCLDVVKNVTVIVTCVAVLYALVEAYFFIGRLQEALQQFADRMAQGG